MTKAKDLLQFAGSCDDLDIDKSQKDWKTMNNPFLDDRPLTDETLEELGFELKADGRWVFIYKRKNRDKPLYDIKLRQGGNLFNAEINGIHQYKTVGSVKMLIEALKGG